MTYQPVELHEVNSNAPSTSFLHEDTLYDPLKAPLQRRKTWRSQLSGYRGGLLTCVVVSSIVCLLNVLLLVLAHTQWNPKDNVATAFRGNCSKARKWTIGLHLLINVLSSLLLGASNYTMQRLAAPTRKEVDAAHAKRKYLDIGTPSMRNLSSIQVTRVLVWVLLGLSSMPLHFLYNSVVFETIAANTVRYLLVTEDFFTNEISWSKTDLTQDYLRNYTERVSKYQELVLNDKYLDHSVFQNLSASECNSRYSAPFITDVGTGFAVVTKETYEEYATDKERNFIEMSGGNGDINTEPRGMKIAYCLSERIKQRCEVQFHTTILIVVIACNATKIVLIALVLWRMRQPTLVTVGDAVQSFIKVPDPTTENCCLMSQVDVKRIWKSPEARLGQRWRSAKRKAYFSANSSRRWCSSVALYLVAIIVALVLFGIINGDENHDGRNEFGRVSVDYIVDINLPYSDSIIPYVLLANLPQAVVSLIYISYNALFTGMLANREWTNYAIKRASLRVTEPCGSQRSTYFLQLPYLYSAPLLICSILLHWFVSQAIFLARVGGWEDGKPVTNVIDRLSRYQHLQVSGTIFSGVGYSDSALLAAIGLGIGFVVISIAVAAICKYPRNSIIGGNNSAVISAACHVRHEGVARDRLDEIVEKPLMWGVTVPGGKETIGHCSFSADEVDSPTVGHLYAAVARQKGD